MLSFFASKTRSTAIILIASVLISVSPVMAARTSSRKLRSDLGSVQSKIRNLRKEIKVKEHQQRSVLADLSSTDLKLQKTQSKLSDNKLRLLDAQTDLDAIIRRLERTKRQLARREMLLRRRVVDIYQGERMDYLNVVLGATDMWSFLTRAYYLQQILDSDTELISQIQSDKRAIEADKRHQMQRVSQIANLQMQLIGQRDQIVSLADSKRDILDQIENSKDLMERALDELEAQSRAIASRIQSLQRTPRGRARMRRAFRGGLSLPCSGRITSTFGYRVHPVTHVYKLHTGVDIGVRSGTQIHAAANGEVILAGWMGAYGYAVVIDHGGGVSTLYGHNSRVLVRVGQKVSRGDVIARSGSTGYSTGPHCHFEKRVNGTPVNPL
ncbi:MAG: peptidoglycan DD-metalloendopeptidase family protein [Armatimonadota bacterium]|nr:peptidoglycan DD-metalloendopeptidase family protein [bacterium]